MASNMKRGKNFANSYTIRSTNINITIKRGSCVIMKPEKPHEPPYIARVEKFMPNQDNKMMVRVRWYYRPEDTEGRRRSYHGLKEVFLGNMYDWLSVDTIERTCVIHTLEEYMKLKSCNDDDYFCRYKYDARELPADVRERFYPRTVHVYCKCERPYNPDLDMVQCDRCLEWYHLQCIGKRIEDVKNQETFSCFKCQDDVE